MKQSDSDPGSDSVFLCADELLSLIIRINNKIQRKTESIRISSLSNEKDKKKRSLHQWIPNPAKSSSMSITGDPDPHPNPDWIMSSICFQSKRLKTRWEKNNGWRANRLLVAGIFTTSQRLILSVIDYNHLYWTRASYCSLIFQAFETTEHGFKVTEFLGFMGFFWMHSKQQWFKLQAGLKCLPVSILHQNEQFSRDFSFGERISNFQLADDTLLFNKDDVLKALQCVEHFSVVSGLKKKTKKSVLFPLKVCNTWHRGKRYCLMFGDYTL